MMDLHKIFHVDSWYKGKIQNYFFLWVIISFVQKRFDGTGKTGLWVSSEIFQTKNFVFLTKTLKDIKKKKKT